MTQQPKIVVIGCVYITDPDLVDELSRDSSAGVIGLTIALKLAQKGYSVTVAAKHMPGDYDIEYASPWAGANYIPLMSSPGDRLFEWERLTWPVLEDLAQSEPGAGIHRQKLRALIRQKDHGTEKARRYENAAKSYTWLNAREIPSSDLAPGLSRGIEFDTVCINTAIYLPWLVGNCVKYDVVLKRRVFEHIADAAAAGVHHQGGRADLVVNCTGLSALKLGGVMDHNMLPVRGQLVMVRNEAKSMYSTTGTDDGSDELSYIMTRAAGGGTILGGCYQEGRWQSLPDADLAIRIMQRAVKLCPELTGRKGIEGLSVIRHGVGLRPSRLGGPRLETENICGICVVHCYGHGGSGYQASYGSAFQAVNLIEEALKTPNRARL